MILIGLLFIILAWVIQLWYFIIHKNKTMDKPFVSVYSFGVLLLVLDSLIQGMYLIAFLNAVTLFLAGFVFLKLIVPQRRK